MIKNLPDRIFLCGFMGTGKSSVGKTLADELAVSFLDLDDHVENKVGKSIKNIFQEDGEEVFRKLERSSVLEVIRNFKGVVALGGGTLQNQHLVDHVKLNGLLVFIETPFSVILKRLTKDKDRPLLLNEDGSAKKRDILENELQALYEQRLPYYRQAELNVDYTKDESVGNMVDRLIKKIRYHVSHY